MSAGDGGHEILGDAFVIEHDFAETEGAPRVRDGVVDTDNSLPLDDILEVVWAIQIASEDEPGSWVARGQSHIRVVVTNRDYIRIYRRVEISECRYSLLFRPIVSEHVVAVIPFVAAPESHPDTAHPLENYSSDDATLDSKTCIGNQERITR